MTDITKCSNKECKMKDKCLRYLAKDNEYWQSYCHFECNKENNWEYMIKVDKDR